MKKHMLTLTLAAVVAFGTINLMAQTTQVSASLSTKFEREYGAVTNVRWTISPNSFTVQFIKDGDCYVAIYNKAEKLVATGRRIRDNKLLPLSIQESLAKEKERCERKYGSVDVGYPFELQGENGTYYIVPIQTDTQTMSFALHMDGSSTLKRTQANPYPRVQPEMIAAAGK